VIRLVKSRPAIAIVAFIVGATVAVGVAWAAIPGSTTGTITACYPTSGSNKGVLRVIDEQAGANCGTGQAKVRWQADGLRWRGVWSSTGTYYHGDVVAHDGSSYVATRPSHAVTPPHANYWALMAAAGAAGPSGVALCGGYPHEGIDWSIPDSTPGNGCSLRMANLDNMVLFGANLTNADLRNATLNNANLHGANLTGADVRNASMTDAYMVDVNLTAANFAGANLSNAVVAGANLTNANLTNANLTGASIQSSNLTGATITDVTWSGTTCPDGTVSDTNGSNPESCVGHGGGL
jgi:hypothetical protein